MNWEKRIKSRAVNEELTSPATWIHHMRNGNFEKAWEFSDEIVRSGLNRNYYDLPRHYQCIWDGTPINGKRVLIRCYHGLGDTIMFIRYAAFIKEIAREVIVWAQPLLIDLLKSVVGIDTLIPLHDGEPNVTFDVDVEVMELSHIFRSTPETIPAEVPYIHVEPMKLSEDAFKVGLVWQVSNWEKSRNIPFHILKPLFEVNGINIIILQAGAAAAGWNEAYGIYPGEFNLYDFARVVKGLDLVITVDSMPAHLAGALKIPVWVMLLAKADWRWMENRTDSPWYPSMKLFRQDTDGDWEGVVKKVVKELVSLRKEPAYH